MSSTRVRAESQCLTLLLLHSIYTELAEQYKRMSPLSKKRGVLAEHLKEVIDTMEHKVSPDQQIFSLPPLKRLLRYRPAKLRVSPRYSKSKTRRTRRPSLPPQDRARHV